MSKDFELRNCQDGTIAVFSDTHLPFGVSRIVPPPDAISTIVLLGDIFDCGILHPSGDTIDSLGSALKKFKAFMKSLTGFRAMDTVKAIDVYWVRGNHEERLSRALKHYLSFTDFANYVLSQLESDIAGKFKFHVIDNRSLVLSFHWGDMVFAHTKSFSCKPIPLIHRKLEQKYLTLRKRKAVFITAHSHVLQWGFNRTTKNFHLAMPPMVRERDLPWTVGLADGFPKWDLGYIMLWVRPKGVFLCGLYSPYKSAPVEEFAVDVIERFITMEQTTIWG